MGDPKATIRNVLVMNETRGRKEQPAATGLGTESRQSPRVGQYVGERYRLDELLGTGGSAQVWRATPVDQPTVDEPTAGEDAPGRPSGARSPAEGPDVERSPIDPVSSDEGADPGPVAVKLLHPYLVPDGSSKLRLIGEARAVRELRHPSIVQLLDVVLNDAEVALVFEYVGGGSLAAEIGRRRRLDARRAAWVASQIAGALEYAHRRDVIHRDVTPRNILLGSDGRPKLADFGIARLLEDSATTVTLTGTVLGTLRYMAPEQLAGREVDGRADVYSLGIVLYEMLAGRPPYDARTPVALVEQQRNGPPSPPGDASPALGAIAMACIRRSAADRPQTAGQVRDALNEWLATGHITPGSLGARRTVVPAASIRALGSVRPRSAVRGSGPGDVAAAASRGVVPGVSPATRPGAGRANPPRRPGILVALLLLGGALFAGVTAFAGLPSGQRSEGVSNEYANVPVRPPASPSPTSTATPAATGTPNPETPEPAVVAPTPTDAPTAAPTQPPAPARFVRPTQAPPVPSPIRLRPAPPHRHHRH